MSNEQTINKLEYLEKGIKASEELRQRALTKQGMYEQQLKETELEFEQLGTTAQQASNEIEKIDAKINEALSNIHTMIPFDLLKEYKMM